MAEFKMPPLGESVTEGAVTRWLKKEGETVAADEALIEVSTDKVDSEIPSPISGVVDRILVQEGDTVAVGAALAEITEAGQAAPGGKPGPEGDENGAAKSPAPVEGRAGDENAGDLAPEPAAAVQVSAPEEQPRRGVLSPLVRRLAKEKKVDLAAVQGTGSGGRITRDDVLRHSTGGNGARAAPAETSGAPSAPAGARPAEAHPTSLSPAARAGAIVPDEVVPLTNMRKLIARNMVASLHETARAWNTVEVDMSRVGRLRKLAGPSFRSAMGYSLTWTPFLARALTQVLLEFPQVNSSWNGDGTITLKHHVNLGIAVALENGLIVPVIKNADQMNLLGLAGEIRDLAERARNKQLSVEEIRDGTFTLTNPGPFGSVMSVPIINPGQAAILAFDSIAKRPVVVTDAEENDSIGIREMVFLSLSWDHRLIDGAVAAQFLARLKALLEAGDFQADLAPYLP